MIELHRSEDRGHSSHGWLDSHHSFSFADHYDPRNMSFGSLRVINEDRVKGGAGFEMHGHRNMEIISYVLSGELAHRDTTGNGSIIRAGNVQRMSAGTGIMHSEFNPRRDTQTHFLQIWLEPNVHDIPPAYERKYFAPAEKRGRLRLILSPDGREDSITVHQDAFVYAGLFDEGETANLAVSSRRSLYLHVARGTVTSNGIPLKAGDALKLVNESQIDLTQGCQAEVLVFDLA